MKNIYILFTFFAVLFAIESCTIINPKEPTPTYVHIDSFKFVPGNLLVQGSSSHKITSIWVYYNNGPVGVFDLPVTFPVITSGNSGLLTIVPGISTDGITEFQEQYPFYYGDTSTLTTNAGQITTYIPKTGYTSATHFRIIEDFENGNNFQKIAGDDSIVTTSDKSLVIEGGHSGYINLPTAGDSSENINGKFYPFVSGNSFIEISYRNSAQFAVGVLVSTDSSGSQLVSTSPEYLIGVNPSASINKMYISLSTEASKYLSLFPSAQFRLAIKSVLPNGQSSGFVIVDNIKYLTN